MPPKTPHEQWEAWQLARIPVAWTVKTFGSGGVWTTLAKAVEEEYDVKISVRAARHGAHRDFSWPGAPEKKLAEVFPNILSIAGDNTPLVMKDVLDFLTASLPDDFQQSMPNMEPLLMEEDVEVEVLHGRAWIKVPARQAQASGSCAGLSAQEPTMLLALPGKSKYKVPKTVLWTFSKRAKPPVPEIDILGEVEELVAAAQLAAAESEPRTATTHHHPSAPHHPAPTATQCHPPPHSPPSTLHPASGHRRCSTSL